MRHQAASPGYRSRLSWVPSSSRVPSQGTTTSTGSVTRYGRTFSGVLLDSTSLTRMTDCSQYLDERCSRGLGIVRYDLGDGNVAFGHHGGVPGFTTVALRTVTGRSIVLYQNGLDAHDILTSETPFIRAALAA